jgi:hypothetical protein
MNNTISPKIHLKYDPSAASIVEKKKLISFAIKSNLGWLENINHRISIPAYATEQQW